ncbi:unnamed protein product [Plutella xylostella]|uniref:(diamondback moth) hypothetical protein n=1 Tax=Plutella xylostella TaxID=51655 RepID=A0A8S4FN61_PLUXY|nr:unnamed protein product [Plutella xylostella]
MSVMWTRPLVMCKRDWDRLQRWSDMDKEDPEIIRKREYLQFLADQSKAMTKTWPNSLENVNRRNEEARRARYAAAEEANAKFYRQYVKRMKQQQQRLMHSARDTIFKNKDAPKLLLSAVIESVVQKERSEQVKFNNERRREANERKAKDEADIYSKAKHWHEENEEQRRRRFLANKEHQRELAEQIKEISDKNRRQYEEELSQQQEDNVKANLEIEAIREFEENLKAEEKARLHRATQQSLAERAGARAEAAARGRLQEQLQEALRRARARVQDRQRATERMIKEEKTKITRNITAALQSTEGERDAKEQASRDRAVKEKIALEDARAAAATQKQLQLRAERAAAHAQYLRDDAERIREVGAARQWEMLNRYKNNEVYEEFCEKQRHTKDKNTEEYRNTLIKQWQEREARDKAERDATRRFYGELAVKKMRAADNKLLTHAAALVEEARRHERPTFPIERAVQRYCLMNRLLPMPDLPSSQQEHFPRYRTVDLTKPDPDYKEPPSPPAPTDEAGASHGDLVSNIVDESTGKPPQEPQKVTSDEMWKTVGRRHGLGDIRKDSAYQESQGKTKKDSTQEQDYKRQGRANGMQQKYDLGCKCSSGK